MSLSAFSSSILCADLAAISSSSRTSGTTALLADLPSDDELLDLVRQWPGICLRQLCALVWPSLS